MRIITIIHHLSSPPINFYESHYFVNPWVKVSCLLFPMVLLNYTVVLLGFHLSFAMKIFYSNASKFFHAWFILVLYLSCISRIFLWLSVEDIRSSVRIIRILLSFSKNWWESNYGAISIVFRSFFILIELHQDMRICSILLENWELSYGIGIFYLNPFTRLTFPIYLLYWKKEKTQ